MKTSHIMCISKILTYLCFTKQRIKAKNTPPKVVCSFSSKNVFTEHKKVCSRISGAQSVRFEKGTINFRNYFKEIPVHLKFMLILSVIHNTLKIIKVLTQKHIKITFLVALFTSLCVLMMNLPSQ